MFLSKLLKNSIHWILATFLVSAFQPVLACDDIVVLSNDARYMVLDSETFQINDVGSLWWLGIRGIESVVPGSTLKRASFWTNSPMEEANHSDSNNFLSLVSLAQLGRMSIDTNQVSRVGDPVFSKLWYIPGDPEQRMISLHRKNNRNYIGILDSKLQPISEHLIEKPAMGLGSSCLGPEGEIIIAGLRDKFVILPDGNTSSDPLTPILTDADYRNIGISSDCFSVLTKFPDTQPSDINVLDAKVERAIVDFSTDTVVEQFETDRFGEFKLINQFNMMIQNDVNASYDGAGSFVLESTPNFSTINFESGGVGGKIKFEEPIDHFIAHCQSESNPILTISSAGTIYRLNASDMSVTHEIQIPFESYFIF